MKRIAMLALVVVMLVTLTGVASAAKPVEATFTINGSATHSTFYILPNGLTSYHLFAVGTSTDYFTGPFTYEEWGTVDIDPGTGQIIKGKNRSILTINPLAGEVIIELSGKIDRLGVTGEFNLQQKDGTGAYRGLDGQGHYSGSGGSPFRVTFTGKFH